VLFQLVLSRLSHLLWLPFYVLRFLSSTLLLLTSKFSSFASCSIGLVLDREPFGLLADALFFECRNLG